MCGCGLRSAAAWLRPALLHVAMAQAVQRRVKQGRCENDLLPVKKKSQLLKDLATPATADKTMASRLKKRSQRAGATKPYEIQETMAMSLSLLDAAPLTADRKERWLHRQVHSPAVLPHTREEWNDTVCGVCWATNRRLCPCGAKFVAGHDASELRAFGAFIMSQRNPCLRAWDPEDQRELLESMTTAISIHLDPQHSQAQRDHGIASLCALVALTGRAATIDRLGPLAINLSWQGLGAEIDRMKAAKVSIFRGGQRPGTIGVARLAAAVQAFAEVAGSALSAAFGMLRSGDQRHGVFLACSVVSDLVTAGASSGVSWYKAKRFVELLALLCYAGVDLMVLVPSDLRVTHSVYPIPRNSCSGLLRIFPGAASGKDQREALRLLQKILKPSTLDIGVVIASLCFWQQQLSGVIDWEPLVAPVPAF